MEDNEDKIENENEKPEGCNFCGYETEQLSFYQYKGAAVEDAWLCKVCSSTYAGNAYHFPRQYENKGIMKQISYCTNLILDAVDRSNKASSGR